MYFVLRSKRGDGYGVEKGKLGVHTSVSDLRAFYLDYEVHLMVVNLRLLFCSALEHAIHDSKYKEDRRIQSCVVPLKRESITGLAAVVGGVRRVKRTKGCKMIAEMERADKIE